MQIAPRESAARAAACAPRSAAIARPRAPNSSAAA